MLESQPKTKFTTDRFISVKNKNLPCFQTDHRPVEKMESEDKTPYEMLISGDIFQS